MIEQCTEGGPTNGRCIYGPGKIKILGRTVLDYWNTSTNEGLEYTLGETRDLLNGADPVQRQMLLGNVPTAMMDTFLSAKGTASYVGNDLTIRMERVRHTTIDRVLKGNYVFKAGEPIFVHDVTKIFTVDQSCSKCAIRHFGSESRVIGGPVLTKQRLVNASCTID
jgi:hypothetical protein